MDQNTFTLGGISLPVNTSVSNDREKMIPKGITYIMEDDIKSEMLHKIMYGVKANAPVIITGPKGTGKTTAVSFLAQETKNPLRYIQLTGATGLDSFVGKWLVNEHGTYWVNGDLAQAMENGDWLVLDELNMALAEITAILNSVMDDRRVLILNEKGSDEVIKAHPNFRIFACINPSEDYAGTKEMNLATVDRFDVSIETEYPSPRKEREIVLKNAKVTIDDVPGQRQKEGVITRMVKLANALRSLNMEQKLIFDCSTRNLISWAAACSMYPVKEAAEFTLISKADKEDRKIIRDEMNKLFRDNEQWSKREVPVAEIPSEEVSIDA